MKRAAFIGIAGLICIATAILFLRARPQQHSFSFASPPVEATTVVDRQDQTTQTLPAADEWPQWRGPNRDGVSSAENLLTNWPDDGPPLAWTAKGLGRGMSSIAVANGRILTMGKREADGVCLIALNVENGEQLWATPIQAEGEPNGTPTIDGDHVFAITYNGALVCAETATGRLVWKQDFVSDFGGQVPQWGYSESPLVDGQLVVCTPGAEEKLIVAFDKATGKMVWTTATPAEMRGSGHDGAGYSSIVISQGAGVRQYVQLFGGGVIGVSPTDGTPLWGYNRMANHVANIPTPIVDGDYVFVSTGYGAGTALLRLERSDAGMKVNEVYFHPGNKMQNHHGGMVLIDGHVYFGNGHNQGFPICVELLTGKIKWGPLRGPGSESAAVIAADGQLYFRYQDAVLALIEATPEAYRLKSSFTLPSHLDNGWSHPVISKGRMYLRDQDVLMCYDLRDGS